MTYSTTFQTHTPGLVEPATDKPPQHAPTDAPRLDPHDGMRIRNASRIAASLLGGALGKLVERELLDWAELGHRVDHRGLVLGAVRQLEAMAAERAL